MKYYLVGAILMSVWYAYSMFVLNWEENKKLYDRIGVFYYIAVVFSLIVWPITLVAEIIKIVRFLARAPEAERVKLKAFIRRKLGIRDVSSELSWTKNQCSNCKYYRWLCPPHSGEWCSNSKSAFNRKAVQEHNSCSHFELAPDGYGHRTETVDENNDS